MTGAPVMLTGRRTSFPGSSRGALTDLVLPSSRWNRGANRRYPNTISKVTTPPKTTSNTAMP
jgi:hypothetical protein